MRTVSQDDELVARGANPRTGLISPFVVVDDTRNKAATSRDYLGHIHQHTPSPLSRHERKRSSGHWRANDSSWGYVQSPLAEEWNGEDEKVMTYSETPIRAFREDDALIREAGVVDRKTGAETVSPPTETGAASNRQSSRSSSTSHGTYSTNSFKSIQQECDSDPQMKGPSNLQMIPRKAVGSPTGSRRRDSPTPSSSFSTPTVTGPLQYQGQKTSPHRPNTAAAAVPTTEPLSKESPDAPVKVQGTQIKTAYKDSSNMLGRQLQSHSEYQLQGSSKGAIRQPTLWQEPPPRSPPRYSNNFERSIPSSPRQPGRRIPPSLLSGLDKRQMIENVANMSPTIEISPPKRRLRPKIQRQDCQTIVPCRASEESRPRKNPTMPIPRSEADVLEKKSTDQRKMAAKRTKDVVQQLRFADELPAEDAKPTPDGNLVKASPVKPPQTSRSRVEEMQVSAQSGIKQDVRQENRPTQLLVPASVITSTPVSEKTMVNSNRATAANVTRLSPKDRTEAADKLLRRPAENKTGQLVSSIPATNPPVLLVRRPSVFSRAKELATMFESFEQICSPQPAKFGSVRETSCFLISHVASSFIQAVSALRTLRDPEARILAYFMALKDISQASLYLLILLHVLMIVQKLLGALSMVLYSAWHPVETLVLVMRWIVVP